MALDFGPYRKQMRALRMPLESAERIRDNLRKECRQNTSSSTQEFPCSRSRTRLMRSFFHAALPVAAVLVLIVGVGFLGTAKELFVGEGGNLAIASAPKYPFDRLVLDSSPSTMTVTEQGVYYASSFELSVPGGSKGPYIVSIENVNGVSLFRQDDDLSDMLKDIGGTTEAVFEAGEPLHIWLAVVSNIKAEGFDIYDGHQLDMAIIEGGINLMQQIADATFTITDSEGRTYHYKLDDEKMESERSLRNVFCLSTYKEAIFALTRED